MMKSLIKQYIIHTNRTIDTKYTKYTIDTIHTIILIISILATMATTVLFITTPAPAMAKNITGKLSGEYVVPDSGITTTGVCTVEPNTSATCQALFDIVLKPGFQAKSGSRFTARILDDDGLPNNWEMAHFGNTGQKLSGDPDGDGLTNWEEYQRGANPNDAYNGEPLANLQYEYDARGRLRKITDDNGNYIEYRYAPSGALICKKVHRAQ